MSLKETCIPISRKEMGPAMAIYTALAAASIWAMEHVSLGIWKIPVAVAPGLSGVLIVRAFMRGLRKMDELQLRIQMESLVFAFASSAILTLTYGFMQAAGFPAVNWVWAWPVMGTMWVIGRFIARRKYR